MEAFPTRPALLIDSPLRLLPAAHARSMAAPNLPRPVLRSAVPLIVSRVAPVADETSVSKELEAVPRSAWAVHAVLVRVPDRQPPDRLRSMLLVARRVPEVVAMVLLVACSIEDSEEDTELSAVPKLVPAEHPLLSVVAARQLPDRAVLRLLVAVRVPEVVAMVLLVARRDSATPVRKLLVAVPSLAPVVHPLLVLVAAAQPPSRPVSTLPVARLIRDIPSTVLEVAPAPRDIAESRLAMARRKEARSPIAARLLEVIFLTCADNLFSPAARLPMAAAMLSTRLVSRLFPLSVVRVPVLISVTSPLKVVPLVLISRETPSVLVPIRLVPVLMPVTFLPSVAARDLRLDRVPLVPVLMVVTVALVVPSPVLILVRRLECVPLVPVVVLRVRSCVLLTFVRVLWCTRLFRSTVLLVPVVVLLVVPCVLCVVPLTLSALMSGDRPLLLLISPTLLVVLVLVRMFPLLLALTYMLLSSWASSLPVTLKVPRSALSSRLTLSGPTLLRDVTSYNS